MGRTVSIVAYHYVREVAATPYPGIKARQTSEFFSQISTIKDMWNSITLADLRAALNDPTVELPDKAVLLTFDDGYADHWENVAPALLELGLQGIFFVPAQPLLERRVMQVNKVQFLLAAAPSEDLILGRVIREIDRRRGEDGVAGTTELWRRHGRPNRFDTATVRFIKDVLQNALPRDVRAPMVDQLFAEFVTEDETAFAEELYMSADNVRSLRSAGMEIGAHGYRHEWMDTLPMEEQHREVQQSRSFLGSLGDDADAWTMAYPYGRWNDSLVDVLATHGCGAAFTVEPRMADLSRDTALCLPRLDTNDIPF